MAKLCPRGKAAAKRKFKVYPSAYANMYASAVCSGKVTPGGKKNRKKAMGGGMMDKRMGLKFGGPKPLETKMDQKKADQTKISCTMPLKFDLAVIRQQNMTFQLFKRLRFR